MATKIKAYLIILNFLEFIISPYTSEALKLTYIQKLVILMAYLMNGRYYLTSSTHVYTNGKRKKPIQTT